MPMSSLVTCHACFGWILSLYTYLGMRIERILFRLFSAGGDFVIGEALGDGLAVLIHGVLGEPIECALEGI